MYKQINDYFIVLLKLNKQKEMAPTNAELLLAGRYSIVPRSMNIFVSFLDVGRLFEEKSRDYSNSYYVFERRKKKNKTKKEEYVFKRPYQLLVVAALVFSGRPLSGHSGSWRTAAAL